jgi:integrase
MNEILTLRWEWVDLEHGCLRLPDSKTGSKLVPLGEPALALLTTAKASRSEDNLYVIPGRRKGKHLVNVQKPWRRIRQHAGLDGVRIHDLRHLYASVAASAGLGLPIIGAILGHREAATTQRYAHLDQNPLRLAADRISGEIAASLVNGTGASYDDT